MTRYDISPANLHIIIKPRAAAMKDAVEDIAHGEHGRAGINGNAIHLNLPGFSAHCRLFLDHSDLVAARRQLAGACEPTHTCADHDNLAIH